MDSRVIIDSAGAEKLIGKGDMLYQPIGMNKPLRVQGCWISDAEVSGVTSFLKSTGEESEYDPDIISEMEKQAEAAEKSKSKDDGGADDNGMDLDERINEAVELVCREGQASTSLLQRKLKLGYARAARIIDEMADNGVIGPFEGAKPRKVLMTYNQWLERINGAAVQETLPDAEEDVPYGVSEQIDNDDDGDEPPFDTD